MATVVRTPRRQSLADFAETGTSAWELFVNGISFDTSEDTEQLQENTWSRLDAQVSLKEANKMGKALQAGSKANPDHMGAQVTAGSFLGIGSEKKDDPGGKRIRVGALTSITSRTAKEEMFQEDAPMKCARDTRALRNRKLHRRTHTMEHENMKLLKRRLLPSLMDKFGSRNRENTPQIAESHRKMMPTWGHWMERGTICLTQMSKTSSPRMLDGLGKIGSRQQREDSALNLELDPNGPCTGRSELDPRLAQHVAPSRLMLTWGMNMKYPSVDQEPKQLIQTQVPDSGAENRQDESTHVRGGGNQTEATKDMTMKRSAPAVTECASTHIITTTGCDRLCPETSCQAKSERKNKHRRAQPGDHQKDGAVYNLPLIATSENSLGSSVMRILQKPSSRVRMAKVGDEIGITSKYNQRQERFHTNTNTNTKHFLDTCRAVANKPDVRETTGPETKEVRIVDHQMSKQRGDMPVGQGQLDLEEIDDMSKHVENPAKIAAAAVARGHRGILIHVDMVVQDELTALVQAPGRFPDSSVESLMPHDGHLSSGNHSAASNAGIGVAPKDVSFGSLLKTTGEFLGLVWCYMLPLWQVYWERVGPLFDLRSEYWARQNRDEGTTGDCLTVVLAIPTSLLFIASYVVALRLGLLCIENCQAVREWAESVYWYMMEE
ncbi:hypothetical protein E4U21_005595 [Claviceps maximensis]|nr:hypothetical protein E4U21_005595 [Claviceps maximensis]